MKTWEFALEEMSERIKALDDKTQHLIAHQLDFQGKANHQFGYFEGAVRQYTELQEKAIAPLDTRLETLEKAVDELWHWKAESQCALVSQPMKTIETTIVEQPVKRLKDRPDVTTTRKPDSEFPGYERVTYTYPGGQHTNREPAQTLEPQPGQPGDVEQAIAEMKEYCGDDDGETPLKPVALASRLKVSKGAISQWQRLPREKQKANTKRHDPSGFSWQYSDRKKLWYPYPPEAGI